MRTRSNNEALVLLDTEKVFVTIGWDIIWYTLELCFWSQVYTMGAATRLIPDQYYSYRSESFSADRISSGDPAGISLTTSIFILVVEPLAYRIGVHPRLEALDHRGLLFADDI